MGRSRAVLHSTDDDQGSHRFVKSKYSLTILLISALF